MQSRQFSGSPHGCLALLCPVNVVYECPLSCTHSPRAVFQQGILSNLGHPALQQTAPGTRSTQHETISHSFRDPAFKASLCLLYDLAAPLQTRTRRHTHLKALQL